MPSTGQASKPLIYQQSNVASMIAARLQKSKGVSFAVRKVAAGFEVYSDQFVPTPMIVGTGLAGQPVLKKSKTTGHPVLELKAKPVVVPDGAPAKSVVVKLKPKPKPAIPKIAPASWAAHPAIPVDLWMEFPTPLADEIEANIVVHEAAVPSPDLQITHYLMRYRADTEVYVDAWLADGTLTSFGKSTLIAWTYVEAADLWLVTMPTARAKKRGLPYTTNKALLHA